MPGNRPRSRGENCEWQLVRAIMWGPSGGRGGQAVQEPDEGAKQKCTRKQIGRQYAPGGLKSVTKHGFKKLPSQESRKKKKKKNEERWVKKTFRQGRKDRLLETRERLGEARVRRTLRAKTAPSETRNKKEGGKENGLGQGARPKPGGVSKQRTSKRHQVRLMEAQVWCGWDNKRRAEKKKKPPAGNGWKNHLNRKKGRTGHARGR